MNFYLKFIFNRLICNYNIFSFYFILFFIVKTSFSDNGENNYVDLDFKEGSARVIPAPFETWGHKGIQQPNTILPPNEWQLNSKAHIAKKTEKLEINISSSDTVCEKYAPIYFTINHNLTFSNPYNPDDIKVDLYITAPDSSNLILPCFYKSGYSGGSSWEGRFTPKQVGVYFYKAIISKQGSIQNSEIRHFISKESNRNGFLHLDKNNPGCFVFDSGKRFKGVGQNFAWEGNGYTYQSMSKLLKNYECTFYRTWMCPWNMPLEWTSSGVGYYSESSAKKLDSVLYYAEQNDLYILLVLDYHGVLWIDADSWGGNNYWPQNPYNKANGGPCATPNDFFANHTAQEFYKKRLRYIIARWGYNTRLASIEFFNEVDHDILKSGCTVAAVSAWHDTMTTYLRQIDIFGHPLQTSVSYNEYPSLINVSNLDIMQQHYYGSQSGEGGVTQNFNSESLRYLKVYKKPLVIGEFSRYWEGANYGPSSDYSRILHLGMWRGNFSITPIVPMTWWWEAHDRWGDYSQYRAVSLFVKSMTEINDAIYTQKKIYSPSGIEALCIKTNDKIFFWAYNTQSSTKSNIQISIDSVSKNSDFSIRFYDTYQANFYAESHLNSRNDTINFIISQLGPGQDIAGEIVDLKVNAIKKYNNDLSTKGLILAIKNGRFNIVFKDKVIGNINLKIYDSSGRLIYNENKFIPSFTSYIDFNKITLANEIYFAQIISNKIKYSLKIMTLQ